MIVKVTRIGGSRALILPSDICELMGIADTSELEMDVERDLMGRVITVRKVKL